MSTLFGGGGGVPEPDQKKIQDRIFRPGQVSGVETLLTKGYSVGKKLLSE